MARDKEFEWRMQGMIYAYNMAKEQGVEALEKDIKKRNILRAPMRFTQKQIDEYWDMLSANIYNNMLTAVCYTLNYCYGFGAKRIAEFKKKYDSVVQDALDLDYMGEHYVKLEDFAVELNEKFNIGIDIARVAMCQDSYDVYDRKYHMANADRLVEELMEAGFIDASEWLKKKIS